MKNSASYIPVLTGYLMWHLYSFENNFKRFDKVTEYVIVICIIGWVRTWSRNMLLSAARAGGLNRGGSINVQIFKGFSIQRWKDNCFIGGKQWVPAFWYSLQDINVTWLGMRLFCTIRCRRGIMAHIRNLQIGRRKMTGYRSRWNLLFVTGHRLSTGNLKMRARRKDSLYFLQMMLLNMG